MKHILQNRSAITVLFWPPGAAAKQAANTTIIYCHPVSLDVSKRLLLNV